MEMDIVVNGATLRIKHIKIAEGRPTIIFLHHSLGSIGQWRDFPKKLGESTNCNVLIYDREGYGQSSPLANINRTSAYLELEADALKSVIDQCGIKEAILYGHSDGGSIALIAAAKYPEHIIGIVSEAAHIFVEEITLQGVRDAVQTYRTTDLKTRLKKYHGDKTDTIFRAWSETWLNEKYRSWNIEHFLRQIKCPVLVIQGENDDYATLAQVYGITDVVPGYADHLIIPKIGHTPHHEACEQVLERATQFIGRLDVSS